MAENFREVNELLSSLWGFATLEGTELGGNEVEDLLSFFAKNLVTDERSKSALGGVGTVADLQNVLQRNGTAQATVEPRTEEWFQEHGEYEWCWEASVRVSIRSQALERKCIRIEAWMLLNGSECSLCCLCSFYQVNVLTIYSFRKAGSLKQERAPSHGEFLCFFRNGV